MYNIQNMIDDLQSNISLYNNRLSLNDKKVIIENAARLKRIKELLDVDKYKLVFIGAPGTGKTTLICNYLNLILDKFVDKEPDSISLLNTASGRTTSAEVHILKGKRTLIRVDSYKLKEQEGFIRNYCRSLWDKAFDVSSDETNAKSDSIELDRVIMNMAQYSKAADIEADILNNYTENDFERFYDNFITKTNIRNRTVLSVVYDDRLSFKLWLKKTFSDINLGKMPGIPIPKCIYVQISPEDYDIAMPDWADEIIDTRGFDGESRSDIKALIHQDNTINLILDRITTPIDERLHPIFNSWVVKEDVDIIPRLSLVLACRNNELNSVCDAENEEEGEELKRSEIKRSVSSNKLVYDIDNTIFFNAQGAYELKSVVKKSGSRLSNVSVIADINSDNARIYREYFSEQIAEIKNTYRNNLIEEAQDISERSANIFKSFTKQPTIYEIERNRVASKLQEISQQALLVFTNNKYVLNSYDTLFDEIKNKTHWATVRKTTNTYGVWIKCHIYAKMEDYLWAVVSKEISVYKSQVDQLLTSISPELSDYIKSYQTAERSAFLELKRQVEVFGYNKMFDFFNSSNDNPRMEFWSKARNIHGRGYLNNVINCYKEWGDNQGYHKDLPEEIRKMISRYFDAIIDIVS